MPLKQSCQNSKVSQYNFLLAAVECHPSRCMRLMLWQIPGHHLCYCLTCHGCCRSQSSCGRTVPVRSCVSYSDFFFPFWYRLSLFLLTFRGPFKNAKFFMEAMLCLRYIKIIILDASRFPCSWPLTNGFVNVKGLAMSYWGYLFFALMF